VHLDSLQQLALWGRSKLGKEVSLRLNQGIGAGHHAHVITGGPDSKFGITLADLPKAQALAREYGLIITALQQHIGSNVLDHRMLVRAAKTLLGTAASMPSVTHIDFGGGLGVPYRGERPLDTRALGRELRALTDAFERKAGRKMRYALEPGRFLVAESGTLLVEVADIKETERHTFIGVNSGFNHLVRPAMYDAYHAIENVSRNGRASLATVSGNICESGDIFGRHRSLPRPRIGDILAIRTTGAYGFSMASEYNLRRLPKEVLRSGTAVKDISFDPSEFAK
jgi:diaminopimelate decarboxylase